MSRIILHGRISNLLEFVHPIHNFFADVIQVNRVSVASLILQSSTKTVLLLLLDLHEHVLQYSPFIRALEVNVLLVLLFQSLESIVPKIWDVGCIRGWSESGHGREGLARIYWGIA